MKLLIVKSKDESRWGSCRVISPNLHLAYGELSNEAEVHWFEIAEEIQKYEIGHKESCVSKLLEMIKTIKPDKIIFVDHLPVPPLVMSYLTLLYNVRRLPSIVVHVYGDFTYFAEKFSYLNQYYEGHKVKFITASKAQKNLLNYFLNENDNVEQYCFPVNNSEYYFDAEERKVVRSENKLTSDEFVLIYTGRISLQKNVDLLISTFSELKKKNPEVKLKLWLVGGFDDVGADFLGFKMHHGQMFYKINNQVANLPKEIAEAITFFGYQDKVSMRKLLNASDLFVSLSLYHDEDYGMSPAEALSTGIRSLLTDWGGYSSFCSDNGWDCKKIGVDISDFGLTIETGELKNLILNKYLEKFNDEKRANYADNFQSEFSIKHSAKKLLEILKKPENKFLGFNWKLPQMADALDSNWKGNQVNKYLSPEKKNFYFEIYKNYITKYFE